MKILFVDDEPSIRELFFLAFQNKHELLMAEDGEEALKIFFSNQFDLIITDVCLPKLNGIDMIKHIRSEGHRTPFIIITGDINIDIAIDTFRLGAIDFFLKPFKMSAIQSVVDKFESININADDLIQSSDFIQISENAHFQLLPKIRRINYYVNMLIRKLSTLPNLSEDDFLSIKVILFELLSNAIEHGTAGINYTRKKEILERHEDYYSIVEDLCNSTDKKIFVSTDYNSERIKITIRDEGKGFDYNKVPNPIKNPSANLFSGRGLFLTKMNTDSIEFNESGNTVTITKNLTTL